jgi:hypothetical protein
MAVAAASRAATRASRTFSPRGGGGRQAGRSHHPILRHRRDADLAEPATDAAQRAARLAADIDILLPELDAAIPDNGDSDMAPLDSSPMPLDTAPGKLDEHPAAAVDNSRTEAAGEATRH